MITVLVKRSQRFFKIRCSPRLNDTYSPNRTASHKPAPTPSLHLTHWFITGPRSPRARAADPEAKQQLVPQSQALPPGAADRRLLRLLALAPPLRLAKSLRRDLVQPFVLDAQLAPARPKVAAVADDADVEGVRGVACSRESVGRLARCEAVKAEEVHEEARAASRRVVVASATVDMTSYWRRVSRERIIRIGLERMRMAVAHLRRERTTAPTHEAVPAEVGHLERRHLS